MYNQIYNGSFGMIEVICDNQYVTATRFIDVMIDVNPNELTNEVIKQITEYDIGIRNSFKLPIKFTNNFSGHVLKTLSEIKDDQVYSYKDLATLCGNANASRAVGTIMAKNKHPLIIPCHLIIKSDGTLGNYQYGLKLKEKLIKINLKNGGNNE